jgi:hypothetical protein
VIGLMAALGCITLGLRVLVLGSLTRPPVMLVESDVRGGVCGILP